MLLHMHKQTEIVKPQCRGNSDARNLFCGAWDFWQMERLRKVEGILEGF